MVAITVLILVLQLVKGDNLLVKRGVAGVNDPRTERCMAGERVEGSEEERGIYMSSSIIIGVYYVLCIIRVLYAPRFYQFQAR